ncbi:hypothetical protein ACP4OV_029216 [Aristida adscensionis]
MGRAGCVAGELRKVLDPRASLPATLEALAVVLVAAAAVRCVGLLQAKERPAMSGIVDILDKAVKLCALRDHGDGERWLRSGRSSLNSTEKFTFAQLHTATGGFAAEAQIGEGSFGWVYRGELDDGRVVAVKCSRSGPQLVDTKLLALGFIAGLHHNHLVRLVGYCLENGISILPYEISILPSCLLRW